MNSFRYFLTIIFGLSGAAALAFETLWFRQLGLALGNQVWTATLVFSAFMAGMSLGYMIAARIADRLRFPVRVYGAAECFAAVMGLVLVIALPAFNADIAQLAANLAPNPTTLNGLRLAIGFALLLLPATAMGMTLPLLVRAIENDHALPNASGGIAMGKLYAWNTVGAASGTLATEFVLIELFGILGTGVIAASLMFVIAAIAWLLGRQEFTTNPTQNKARNNWASLAAAFIAGLIFLAMEPIWFRLLLLSNRGTGETFAMLLAVLLVGLSVGAWISQRLLKHIKNMAGLAFPLALSASVCTVAGYRIVATGGVQSCCNDEIVQALIHASVLILPCAIASGALLPVLVGVLQQKNRSASQSAGHITAANAAGGAIGAIIGGLVVLPSFGIEAALFALSAAYLVIGLLIRPKPRSALIQLAIAAVAIIVIRPLSVDQQLFDQASAEYRAIDQSTTIAIREGLNETAQLLEQNQYGQPFGHRLMTNSYSMSNTERDSRRYMGLYVWLPVAIHPGMESALLISYGVGSTARALVNTAEFKRIDVVDTSADILELSALIHGANDPLLDPRITTHIDDGRFFLNSRSQRYDLITGEPPPPRLAGISNLYSQEYFELLRSRLNPGGLVSYWLPVDQLDVQSSLSIIRAFCNAFGDCSLWAGSNYNLMLMGSNALDCPVSAERFVEQWQAASSAELKSLGFERPSQIGATFIADQAALERLSEQTAPLRDNWPKRLNSAKVDQSDLETYQQWLDVSKTRQRFLSSTLTKRWWPAPILEQTASMFDYQPILNNEINTAASNPLPLIDHLLEQTDLIVPILWLLDTDVRELELIDNLALKNREREYLRAMATRSLIRRDYLNAERFLAAYHEKSPFDQAELHIYLLCKLAENGKAKALAASWKRHRNRAPDFSCW